MMFPGFRSRWTILLACMKDNPTMQSLKTGKNYSIVIGFLDFFIFYRTSCKSSLALSIRIFKMNGFSFYSISYSTNMSRRGINGAYAGKSKCNYVSRNTLENSSKFASWICFKANYFPSLFLTQYTFPNVPSPRIWSSLSCPLNLFFYKLSLISGIFIGLSLINS